MADTREFDELGLGNTPKNTVSRLARRQPTQRLAREAGTFDRVPNGPQIDVLRRRRLKGVPDMWIVGEAISAVGFAAHAVVISLRICASLIGPNAE